MGLFGTDIQKLVARRDIPALWKLYLKKKFRVGGEELCQFHDQSWDYVYDLYLTRKAKQNDVSEFAMLLSKQGHPYAGRLEVTPAEFAARLSVTGSMAKDSWGRCPACGELLSSGKSGSSKGHYRMCRGCRRYYHEGCAALLDRCKLCEGWQWRRIIRTRVK